MVVNVWEVKVLNVDIRKICSGEACSVLVFKNNYLNFVKINQAIHLRFIFCYAWFTC